MLQAVGTLNVVAAALSALSLVLLIASGPLHRVLHVPYGLALGAIAFAMLLGALGAFSAALAFAVGRAGSAPLVALAALLVGGGVALIVGLQIVAALKYPMIHDISTDLVDRPVTADLLARRGPGANPVTDGSGTVRSKGLERTLADVQREAYPRVVPLYLDAPPDAVLDDSERILRELGLEVLARDDRNGIIEATAKSRWFGFVDDVIVRVREEGGRTRVDVRSISRAGKSDLGVNARRIKHFLEALDRDLD